MICPVCRQETINGMSVNFVEKLNWVRCSCGSIFQEKPEACELSKEYLEAYKNKKFYEASAQHPVRTYFPLIEEMLFGRKMLEADSLDFEVSNAAARRGWVTFATAKEGVAEGTHVFHSNFTDIEEAPDPKFDLIFSYHNIEKNPELIKKFSEWLTPGGILFIATPDAHFVDEVGVLEFGHWFKENKVLYSKRMLALELEKNNFEVILARANSSARFIKANDMHIIARRKM